MLRKGEAPFSPDSPVMTSTRTDEPQPFAGWLRLAVLALTFVVLGVPVNDIAIYALLVILTVVLFVGQVRTQARAWLIALAIVAVAIAGQVWLAPPRIDEGFNVFLPSPALERGLPPDVYRHLAQEFDKAYPPDKRCDPAAAGCWRGSGFPDRTFAFSADGIFNKSDMSRAVTELDFSNPVWHRLGFINDTRYNWYPVSDIQRALRDRRLWMGIDRWQLTMPWYEMIRLPSAYVGGQLCWRGDVLWEGAEQRFSVWRGDGCRVIEPADSGRRVVGVAIKPDSLAMRLEPPLNVRLMQLGRSLLVLVAAGALILTLVRFNPYRTIVPFILIGLAALVIVVDDASFLGGVRPFDGGDDGLFYENAARSMLQKLLVGDVLGFFEGGESVFYYGGPGLRYFRAIEHIVFGDSFLGYLSLVLLLPFLVLVLFKRFLPSPWPLALTLLFVAVPVGALFGTTFIDYSKWAARGFADPAAYILFIAGLLPLLGDKIAGPSARFTPAFFGALLLAFAIAMKPVIVVAAAVFLGGAGLHALYYRLSPRLAGLCLGFLPVFSMALHNWYFGGVFVLFSSNASIPELLAMPPSAWLAAMRELFMLDVGGEHLSRAFMQIANWLAGPAESYWTVPLNVAGLAILVYVVVRGRQFDPWLRLIGAAALAQHIVALLYVIAARYHFLSWFLTVLVDAVFVQQVGLIWLQQRHPAFMQRVIPLLWPRWLAARLNRLQKVST